jgi:putative ABC transport system permease protein
MWSDLRYSLRILAKSPGFVLVAIAALALGIGANTAIFTVVNATLLRPLPFNHSDRLVMVWESSPHNGNKANVVNPTNFLAWRDRNHSFEQIAAFVQFPANLSGAGDPEQIDSLAVTKDFFSVLRVQPELGRTFTAEEDAPNGPNAVILSHALWQRKFGGNPRVIGTVVRVNAREHTIVGVMPPGFRLPDTRAELWRPAGLRREPYRGRFLSTLARLLPGSSIDSAQADMNVIAAQLRQERPEFNAKWGAYVNGLKDQATGDVRTPLLILLGAVAFVLLIACANLANLMLIRATGRRREVALRLSLGASHWRIARQLLTESLLISITGGIAGLLFASWATRILIALTPESISVHNVTSGGLDRNVYLFTLGLSVITGLLFGLAPAFRGVKVDLNESLKEGTRAVSAKFARNPLRAVLVVGEIALSFILLVGAGLMLRSLQRLTAVSPGFDPQHTLSMNISFGGGRTDTQDAAFLESALERIRQIPGVRAAGAVHFLPLSGMGAATGFRVGGRPVPNPGDTPVTDVSVISPGYFSAMSIPLINGRTFEPRDRAGSPPVVIINQAIARQFFAGEDPLGKQLFVQWGHPEVPYEIVGVVGDVRQEGLKDNPKPGVFLAHAQEPTGFADLVIRTSADPGKMVRAAEAQIHSLDANVPVSRVRSLDYYVSASLAAPRFHSVLLATFAILALTLAAIGIFGVMSYSVVQRTQEIGVRVALGAQSADVLGMVLRQGMMLAIGGIALGIAGALAITRIMRAFLFEIRPNDLETFCVISIGLAAVAAAAILIPARRAARVDPLVALRYE